MDTVTFMTVKKQIALGGSLKGSSIAFSAAHFLGNHFRTSESHCFQQKPINVGFDRLQRKIQMRMRKGKSFVPY